MKHSNKGTGVLATSGSPATDDLRARARALAQGLIGERAAEIDRTEAYPWDCVEALREAGLLGMTIPVSYGGLGADYLQVVEVVEEIAKACGACGRIVVDTNMGAISAIMAYGTEAQKQLAATLVLSGDKPAICISEPTAGSAATEMKTRADRRGSGFVINGEKYWITGGGVSRLYLIVANVFSEAGKHEGIGSFIVEGSDHDGFVVGEREPAMGIRGIPETRLHFNNLALDETALLAPPGGLRRGFAEVMTAYNSQRVGAAAVALGIAAGAFDLALARAESREQFGRPIAEFQGLQWIIADMSIQLAAARLMVRNAARESAPFPDPLLAAQAKVCAAETAIAVTNAALQVHGSSGYSRRLPLERMVRDARMFTIAGGTAQILRNLIASKLFERKFPQTRDGYAAPVPGGESK
jgi:alkylation response protein AidB-like acyl-CoA dehydrogenase